MTARKEASGGIARRFFLIFGLMAIGSLDAGQAAEPASKPGTNAINPSSQSQRLLDLARQRGRLPIIVELAVTGAAADDEAAIRRAQQHLLADLGVTTGADGNLTGPGVSGVKLYETMPFLALTADAQAIDHLIRNQLVVRIQEDSPVPPN
ncbi:MAG: hypothetical protein U1E42_13470 [Rhodospirillales bacterium]